MKHSYIAFILLLFASPISASGQEILDNAASFRAEYKFHYQKDSTEEGYYSDIYYLDVCESGRAFFYSRATQYRDSLTQALIEQGKNVYEVRDMAKHAKQGLKWYIDKQYANNLYKYYNKFITRCMDATDQLDIPQWKILGDTITINGHLCHKAEASVGGRVWQAWYAPDIPVNDGPWLLWGLPGLILYAQDSNKYFMFRCTDYGTLPQKYHVFLSSDNKLSTSVKMQDLLKAEILFETAPESFMETYLNTRKMGGPDPKFINLPYIPLLDPSVFKK